MKQKTNNWKRELDNKLWDFRYDDNPDTDDIKSFISSLLKKDRQTIIRLLEEALEGDNWDWRPRDRINYLKDSIENIIKKLKEKSNP